MTPHYQLMNCATGRVFEDTGWTLSDPEYANPTLLRTVYKKKQVTVGDVSEGFYRFADWLPIHRKLKGSCAPVTYKSEGLARELGLKNLYITFNGYWPERGAYMNTCSFKETEAYSVCAHIPEEEKRTLVVASAGNTARAFAKVCSDNNIPLLLCVPFDNIDALWFDAPLNPCVKLVCSPAGTDYFDAICLSDQICKKDGYFAEGGAKNIARRDGMGTTLLSAVHEIGRIPDYYFQAIGSGTGTIAAWETNLRLLEDGRYGSHKMRLCPSQNAPFLPMYDAWQAHSREIAPMDAQVAHQQVATIRAKVLSNRKPPYALAGGLYDALCDTNGTIYQVSNDELMQAGQLFERLEGIDIHPAAAVATASLLKQATSKSIDPDKVIMLNITGGGEKRFRASHNISYLQPDPEFIF